MDIESIKFVRDELKSNIPQIRFVEETLMNCDSEQEAAACVGGGAILDRLAIRLKDALEILNRELEEKPTKDPERQRGNHAEEKQKNDE